jgi:hypothetical protein
MGDESASSNNDKKQRLPCQSYPIGDSEVIQKDCQLMVLLTMLESSLSTPWLLNAVTAK